MIQKCGTSDDNNEIKFEFKTPSATAEGDVLIGSVIYICYGCDQECNYLFADGRCYKCTQLTIEEVVGSYD
jgi:prepilin-type processing-associated H-X9-DG protein